MTNGRAPDAARGDAASGTQVLPRDLVPDIARHLEDEGAYRVTLDPKQHQRVVDLRWAALAAGQLLGRRVLVAMTRAINTAEAPITVRMTFAPDHHRPSIPQQRPPGV